MKRIKKIFNFDILVFLASVGLIFIGILFIYSSGLSSSGARITNEYIYQIIWAVSGLVLFFLVFFTDYAIARKWAGYIYALNIFLLLITLVFGKVVNASSRWLGIFGLGIQPSEFAKISSIILLAYYYEKKNNKIQLFSTFATGFFIIIVPVLLILVQPDLGTALVYFPVFLLVSFVAGIKKRYIFFITLTGFIMGVFMVLPTWEAVLVPGDVPLVRIFTEDNLITAITAVIFLVGIIAVVGFIWTKKPYFFWLSYSVLIIFSAYTGSIIFRDLLKEYQMMRLIVFLNPAVDPQGSGWHIIQSLTAVGSGGLSGKGFLLGTHSHAQFIPEQSTDFIFSILAEEWGFLGSLLVISLYAVILIRGLIILFTAKDSFGMYTGVGILSMIFFHFMVNIGMAIGIMPITGLPLFFLSYGGSSLWTVMIGLGFLQSIHVRRYKY